MGNGMGLILTTIAAATTISTGLYWCAAHAPYDTKLWPEEDS